MCVCLYKNKYQTKLEDEQWIERLILGENIYFKIEYMKAPVKYCMLKIPEMPFSGYYPKLSQDWYRLLK